MSDKQKNLIVEAARMLCHLREWNGIESARMIAERPDINCSNVQKVLRIAEEAIYGV